MCQISEYVHIYGPEWRVLDRKFFCRAIYAIAIQRDYSWYWRRDAITHHDRHSHAMQQFTTCLPVSLVLVFSRGLPGSSWSLLCLPLMMRIEQSTVDRSIELITIVPIYTSLLLKQKVVYIIFALPTPVTPSKRHRYWTPQPESNWLTLYNKVLFVGVCIHTRCIGQTYHPSDHLFPSGFHLSSLLIGECRFLK